MKYNTHCDLHCCFTFFPKHIMQFDQPLSDEEFDELDDFLLSEHCADDVMTMDTLHGFLTGLVIGPQEIPQTEWLPCVWGSSSQGKPPFKSEKEAQHITSLIMRYMNEIAVTLEVAPKEYEPLFCEREWEGKSFLDGEAWAWGFWEAIQLRRPQWEPIFHSDLAAVMQPAYLLGSDELEEEEMSLTADPVKAHKLAVELESAIMPIYHYWQQHRQSAT